MTNVILNILKHIFAVVFVTDQTCLGVFMKGIVIAKITAIFAQ